MSEEKKSTDVQQKKRYVEICGDITERSGHTYNQEVLKLEMENPAADILSIIDSYGGVVDTFWSMFDTINLCRCRVHTLVRGKAMSAGALLLISGSKGCRYSTPNATIMFHKIRGGMYGDFDTIDNEHQQFQKYQKKIEDLIVSRTKFKKNDVQSLFTKDFYLNPEEALKWGVIDKIIYKFSDLNMKGW